MLISNLKIKIFADGADLETIKVLYANPLVKGFTTNPTLMRLAGVSDYKAFAVSVLAAVPDRPVSLEVFADDFDEMIAQGLEIGSWARNVNVKIPVVNTRGEFTGPVIRRLSHAGVHVNVTAVFTLNQVRAIAEALDDRTPAYISIFAGRIADSGVDPVPLMSEAVRMLASHKNAEFIWASPRELYNIFHADQAECHIVTVTADLLKKVSLIGKDQTLYSLETAQMFYKDAEKAGYVISTLAGASPRRS
jgi:transaldolase